jgi:hypothetical protein
MRTNSHQTKWWVDALLLSAFFISFLLDLTGVGVHQWLGIAIGIVAGYHLLAHWSWVKAVTRRIARTTWQAHLYYVVDAGIALGFLGILLSGLAISTWFNPASISAAWRELHVDVSIITLALVVFKIAVHWRWIVSVARKYVFAPGNPKPASHPGYPGNTVAPRLQPAPVVAGRRDFLKLMGVVGVASLISLTSALDPIDNTGSASTSTADNSASSASDSQSSSSDSQSYTGSASSGCSVLCPRGCSYPGHCRRYTDSNGNGRCDYGECA